ncbi:response regulator [Bdellovibrio bacteriovorus]|uniref:response regulator n=1 Tax=Bdellovibrio bacteriovorus TaxID=959 RepID=UPI000688468C|nr:response regulator [Bdellovibrio bacteriovorus]
MGFKVLVVDDEKDILVLYKLFLTRAGFTVVTAENGLEAFEKISTESPQLVLSDIRMPIADGLELLKMIDTLPYSLPVVFISGYAGLQREAYQSANFKAFYQKPLKNKELCDIVRSFESLDQSPQHSP